MLQEHLFPEGDTPASFYEFYSIFFKGTSNVHLATKVQEIVPRTIDHLRVVAVDQQPKLSEKKNLGLRVDVTNDSKRNFKRQQLAQNVKQVISKNPNQKGFDKITCFNCQEKGHKANVCPKPRKNNANKKTNSNDKRDPKNNNAMKKGKNLKKNTQSTKQISSLNHRIKRIRDFNWSLYISG